MTGDAEEVTVPLLGKVGERVVKSLEISGRAFSLIHNSASAALGNLLYFAP